MRGVNDDHEPCTINATVVAKYLDGAGMPRMAAYVRDQGGYIERAVYLKAAAEKRLTEALERLQQHEPLAMPSDGGVRWTGD